MAATSDRADLHDSSSATQDGIPARYFTKKDGTLGKRDHNGAAVSDDDWHSSSQGKSSNSFYDETPSPLKSPCSLGMQQGQQQPEGGDHDDHDDHDHSQARVDVVDNELLATSGDTGNDRITGHQPSFSQEASQDASQSHEASQDASQSHEASQQASQ